MLLFSSEKEFREAFEKFNALHGYTDWKQTTARKGHEDLFGVQILEHEVYFKKSLGGWSEVTKLSQTSMEKILYVVIELNPILAGLGQKMHDDYLAKIVAALNH